MAIKELFNDARPQVLFDPRASQRIDPRFKFTRDGVASYYDSQGVLRFAAANQPRIDHDPTTGESLGLLVEEQRTNLLTYSDSLSHAGNSLVGVTKTTNAAVAPDGTSSAVLLAETATTDAHYLRFYESTNSRSFSVYVKPAGRTRFRIWSQGGNPFAAFLLTENGSVTDSYRSNASIEKYPNGWYRCTMTSTTSDTGGLRIGPVNYSPTYPSTWESSYTGDGSSGVYVWGSQLEAGSFPTSYIPTSGSTVTREPDLISIESPLPSTGSIYIDARSLGSDVDDTLLSAAPASPSTDKLALAIREPASLYDSKALVYEVDGEFKPTLPFPVPSNAQERNLITYGANNYHYRSDSARYTPSSSDDVPANMTRLGIGHDVTDPTKAMTGYINAVYLWPGEITPTVAEALVRGDVDPKDADAGVFTPAAGSLAFVFNTQGTATDGDTVVQLPLRGSTNNVLVSWGDNTSSSLIGAAASVTVDHTYTAAGIYPVQIEADDDGTNSGLQDLQFYGNSPADLVRVLQWGGSTTFNPTTMYRAFRDCTQMDFESDARNNLPDTSGCSDWREAFYNCSSLSGSFPSFDFSGATNFSSAWSGCSSMTAFPAVGNQTDGVTNFSSTWSGCSSLTSFPLINTSAGTSFTRAWENCSSLTSFPLINTSAGTSFYVTWSGCSSLTSFPLINTSAGTSFTAAWRSCSSLTSFPLINTSAGTDLSQAWSGCSSLTSFPLIDTSAGTNFFGAWRNCSSLTSFPLINTSAGTSFNETWRGCSSLTSFESIDISSGRTFYYAWQNCSSLTDFPANFFDSWSPASIADQCFHQTWDGCTSLTPASVVNILNSIAASGQSAPSGTGTYDKHITIDWDGDGDPAGTASAAIGTLKTRGWQIYLNGSLQ